MGALEKNVQKSMLLYIGENFFFFYFHTSSAVASPFPQQSFTFLVTPSIKQSLVVQITAVYTARRVKEPMSWGQTGSAVEFDGNHGSSSSGENFFFKC